MREVESLEAEAERLDQSNEMLQRQADELRGQAQEMESHNNELLLQAQELTKQIEEAEAKEKTAKEILAKHDLREDTLKAISKEAKAETKNMKSVAVPITNLFGGEEYVKVKKNDWNKMLDAFSRAVSRNHLLEKYEKKIAVLEKKVADLTEQVEKLKRFVASRGLGEAFVEFVKSLEPKSIKQRIADAREDAAEYNRQREMLRQGAVEKDKLRGQEI